MSYNIDKFTVKRMVDLKIPVDAFYIHERKDWHPTDVRGLSGPVEISCGCEQIISGTIEDGILTVTELDLEGEGSGTFINWIFEPALKQSKGELNAVCIWERGDSINRLLVEDGTVDWLALAATSADPVREAATALDTLQIIANMRVYLGTSGKDDDPAFMRDFYAKKLDDAIKYAETALEAK